MSNIKFEKSVESGKKDNLLKIAKKAGIKISAPCDGKGSCGKCVVKISEGKVNEPTKAEVKKLGDKKLAEGYRLACQVEVEGDVKVSLASKKGKEKK